METIELKVAGMTCASCANSVSKALNRVPGVQDVRVDLTRGTASVVGDQAAQKTPELIAALSAAGYAASADSPPALASGQEDRHAPAAARPKGHGGCCCR
ncbi:TPA: heavy-metal-associated domain-containing protein [Pseudomonas aeruginosa]|jgi:copper chaperone CopZ|nr:heavy-metal-associated domain-containing protein [Pseudomonas aeruginosa]